MIHNSGRNFGIAVDGRYGDVVVATEEVTVTDCSQSGRLVTYDIGGTEQAEGWSNPNLTLRKLDPAEPARQHRV